MRIRITFSVENRGGLVPFHHQFLIAQVFKDVLYSANNSQLKEYPFYSFSGIKGQTRLSKNGLHFNSKKVTIVVSSASSNFIDGLIAALFAKEEIEIANLRLLPELVEEEQPVNFERGTKYICISPLVVSNLTEDGDLDNQFMEPASNEFSDLLYESTIGRLAAYGMDVAKIQDVQKFQLVPDADYISRLRASNKKFSRVYPVYTSGDEAEVRGYTFPFTLFAAPEIQDFIFTCGLGNLCSNGFGMLDLANSDPTERTVIYNPKGTLVSA